MIALKYGVRNPMIFASEEDFFETLGFLVNQKRTDIHWEHNENDGAWGSEGRIHCRKGISLFPIPLKNKFTKGTGNIIKRVNCNAYIQMLVRDFGFTEKKFPNKTTADIIAPSKNEILTKIPQEFFASFDKGYSA